MAQNKWEVAGGGEKPLFLLVLSSAHIDEQAAEYLAAQHSRAEGMHRSLLRRYGQRKEAERKDTK